MMDDIDFVDLAWEFANHYHGVQKYGEECYMYHLLQVVEGIKHCSQNHMIVAYLHDILEDTDCTEECLREHFSDEIVDAVVAITKVDGEDYIDYIKRVTSNAIAHKVKIYDTLCNLTESVKTERWNGVRRYCGQLELLTQGVEIHKFK